MLNIINQKLNLSPELRKKINWAKNYSNIDITIEKGSLIRLEPTNIAYVEPHKVIINENAAKALAGNTAVSLLPIGIISIEGKFEKDDIVKITDNTGHFLGVGKAQYNSEKATQLIGKKNQKPLIHYDYLYLE